MSKSDPTQWTAAEFFLARWKTLLPSFGSMFSFDDCNGEMSDWINDASLSSDRAHSVKCAGTGNLSLKVIRRNNVAAFSGGAEPTLTGSDQKWIFGGVMWFEDAVDAADDWRAFSITNAFANTTIVCGLIAPDVSSTHFGWLVRNNVDGDHVAASTVAFSTGRHYVMMFSDGANVFGSVDGETPVLICDVSKMPAGTLKEFHGAISGATTCYIDAVCIGAERP